LKSVTIFALVIRYSYGNRPSVRFGHLSVDKKFNYTLCSKKHVFDDKMNYNSPFTKLFGTLWSHFWDTVYNLYFVMYTVRA